MPVVLNIMDGVEEVDDDEEVKTPSEEPAMKERDLKRTPNEDVESEPHKENAVGKEEDDDGATVFVVRLLLAAGDEAEEGLGQLQAGGDQVGALDGRLSLVQSEPLLSLQAEVGRSRAGLRREVRGQRSEGQSD